MPGMIVVSSLVASPGRRDRGGVPAYRLVRRRARYRVLKDTASLRKSRARLGALVSRTATVAVLSSTPSTPAAMT
jgi:hypothetical protein